MKNDNAKLLLGLGLGILVGGAVGFLLAADKEKLREDFDHAVDGVKEGARNMYSRVKSTAEQVMDRAEDLKDEVCHKASKVKKDVEKEIEEV